MDARTDENSFFSRESELIERSTDFAYEDALAAFERSYRYFLDTGENKERSREMALDMVERAVEAAPRFGFSLRGMVDYMVLGFFHRLPRSLSFIA